jgi:hypothetical protein
MINELSDHHIVICPEGFSISEVVQAIKICQEMGLVWKNDSYAIVPSNVKLTIVPGLRGPDLTSPITEDHGPVPPPVPLARQNECQELEDSIVLGVTLFEDLLKQLKELCKNRQKSVIYPSEILEIIGGAHASGTAD